MRTSEEILLSFGSEGVKEICENLLAMDDEVILDVNALIWKFKDEFNTSSYDFDRDRTANVECSK